MEDQNRTARPILRPILLERIGRFPDRLKEAIGKESLRSFGRRTGVSEGALRHYINGGTFPDLDRLVAIADAAGVFLEWLITGEGPKNAESATSQIEKTKTSIDLNTLQEVIEMVETALNQAGKHMDPREKAELITRVYDFCQDVDIGASKDKLLKIIQSAA